MYLKREYAPKSWPVTRKGSKYVVRPSYGLNKGLSILMIIRDMLKLAKNRKEVKKIIKSKDVLLNLRPVKDEKEGVSLFDNINFPSLNKHYQISLSDKGKFRLKEVGEEASRHKVCKLVNKKILKGKKVQLNLNDGRNFISDMKCDTNDSVVIDLKQRKIAKCIQLREKAKVMVFAGKHAGLEGVIKELKKDKKIAELETPKGEVNVLIKQLLVVE